MKKILKPLISVIAIGALILSIHFDSNDVLASDITKTCDYDPVSKVNPDFTTMNCLLTETALKYDVPPEIVKAIAEGESGNWRHFNENGEAIVTADNGIGIMQITNQAGYDKDRLKSDVVYNIQAGVEILNHMFERTDLPRINGGERDVLEHWYFAVMAYNGTKPVNSPTIQATGERNTKAYQERIFRIVNELGLVKLADLPFSREHFTYDSNSSENIKFTKMEFEFELPLTKSKHYFKINQKVSATTNNVRIRPRPSTTNSNPKGSLSKGDIVTITGPFKFDESSAKNHFVWYPVKTSDGIEGYVASSFLNYLSSTSEPTPNPIPTMTFKDIPANHYAIKEIYYLAERNIINGVEPNKFGLGQGLTRWQAVLMLNRVKNVSLANRPDPGFTDVPKNHKNYHDIAAAVDAGLFNGTSSTTFEPDRILTRGEMAAVLQRIYDFPEPSSKHPFTDVKDEWFAESVARLYASGVTNGVSATTFEPYSTISREQFAIFLARSMDETFRKK